jgi:predicted ATPase
LALYAGDLLPEDLYQDWTRMKREHLGTIYQRLLLKLARVYEETEQFERSINLYMQLIARDRSNEEIWRQLILLHALAGDRSQALHQYEQCRTALLAELDAQPSPLTKSLRQRILTGEIKSRAVSRTRVSSSQRNEAQKVSVRSNLPHPVTSFVGRKQDIKSVKILLAQHRLVTLTGTGGIGKTRLALQIAAEVKDEYGDGVWLVDLTSMLDGALVPRALVAVLGVREEPGRELVQTLAEFLSYKDVLLLLDNCEHLLASCVRLIDALLHQCPGLHIMATSREVLGVEGEALWRLDTLSVPEQHNPVTADELLGYEAAQLFLDRAALRGPSFKPTPLNASAIAQLCRRLDGIPLAIELAAARIEILNVEQILSKLNDGFRLLATNGQTITPRHQTLHTAIDWSYRLLHENERALLRRLSILAGEWSLEAAEDICTGDLIDRNDVLELLSNLVDKSLRRALASVQRFRRPGQSRARLRQACAPGHTRVLQRP